MGTDIDSFAQVRFKVPNLERIMWRDVIKEVGGDNRAYATFFILAGVRSKSSYAVKPISAPKGLPQDLLDSPRVTVLEDTTTIELDLYYTKKDRVHFGHDISYLTLEEIESYMMENGGKNLNKDTEDDEYREKRDDTLWSQTNMQRIITELQVIQKIFNVTSKDVRIVFGFGS